MCRERVFSYLHGGAEDRVGYNFLSPCVNLTVLLSLPQLQEKDVETQSLTEKLSELTNKVRRISSAGIQFTVANSVVSPSSLHLSPSFSLPPFLPPFLPPSLPSSSCRWWRVIMRKDQQLKQHNNSEQLSVKLRNTRSKEVSVQFVEIFIRNTRHKFHTH